jgi:hypothetical protein
MQKEIDQLDSIIQGLLKRNEFLNKELESNQVAFIESKTQNDAKLSQALEDISNLEKIVKEKDTDLFKLVKTQQAELKMRDDQIQTYREKALHCKEELNLKSVQLDELRIELTRQMDEKHELQASLLPSKYSILIIRGY